MAICDKIQQHIQQNGISIAWLGRQLDITRGQMNNILKGRRTLHDDKLKQINKVLKTKFK